MIEIVGGGIVAVGVGVNGLVGVALGSTMVGVGDNDGDGDGDGINVGVALVRTIVGVVLGGIIVGTSVGGGMVGELMAISVGEFAGRVATSAMLGGLGEKKPMV